MTFTSGVRKLTYRFFEYDTPKIVHIRSLKVGILFRMVQLIIIAYIIGVVMIYKKGYQETDEVESSVTSKVKGVILTNSTGRWSSADSSGLPSAQSPYRVWDTPDYIIPPQENGAFFVTTNFIETPDQSQGICNEPSSACQSDSDCPSLSQTPNGVRTGKCNITETGGSGFCLIYSWCPVENDITPASPQLPGTEDFTVLVKNQIIFPKFNVRRRNIMDDFSTNSSLSACHYDAVSNPYCPVFRLGDIINYAGENYTELAVQGGVIGFVIQWDCNLDLSLDNCRPKYSFRRIDNKSDVTAKGWNFRYANYWTDTVKNTSTQKRTLTKAYGLRFVFYVYGTAGKFNFVPFATNLGAGLALLGLSVVVCDVILLYCTKNRSFYADNKYHIVKDHDALLVEDSQKSNYSYSDFHNET